MKRFAPLLLLVVGAAGMLAWWVDSRAIPIVEHELGTTTQLVAKPLAPGLDHPHADRYRNLDEYWGASKTVLDDLYHLYNPDIVRIDAEPAPLYRMYLFGWARDVCNSGLPGCDAIFYGHSTQLDDWHGLSKPDPGGESALGIHLRPTLTAGTEFWNQWHIGDPSVIRVGELYFASFSTSGFDQDGINPHPDTNVSPNHERDRDDYYYSIGGATSADGVSWQTQATPLLSSPTEFGVRDFAIDGTFQRPSLLYEDGRFKMWFDYFHANPGYRHSMGYAEAIGPPTVRTFQPDNWVVRQAFDYPAIPNWPNPEIVRLPFGYVAFADPKGHGDEKWVERKTSMAFSRDGLSWRILGFLEHDQDCDANHIPEAFADGDRLHLFTACMVDLRYRRLKQRVISFARLQTLLRDTKAQQSIANRQN